MLIQADEILDAISDGVAVVDPDLRIIWANPEFHSLADPDVEPIGSKFYQALGNPEVLGPDPCPFTSAVASQGAGQHGRCGSAPTAISASRSRRSSTPRTR